MNIVRLWTCVLAVIVLAVIVLAVIVLADCQTACHASPPTVTVTLKAPKSEPFERIVTILQSLKEMGMQDTSFAVAEEDKISAAVHIRDDVVYIDREVIARKLKEAGVDEVTFATVEVFPWKLFTVEAFDEARATGRTVLVFNRADWCVDSQEIDRTVFSHKDVIRAAKKADFVGLLLDQTDRPSDDVKAFLKANRTWTVPTVLAYSSKKNDSPVTLADKISRDKVLELLSQFPKR